MRSTVTIAELIDAGPLRPGTKLHAVSKGRRFEATLLRDATIAVDGFGVYHSPSLAANAVAKRNTNGWTFWKTPEGRTLAELRADYLA